MHFVRQMDESICNRSVEGKVPPDGEVFIAIWALGPVIPQM